MPCESCAVQFSVFKHKRMCGECERYYCSRCLRRGGGSMCAPCRVLSTRPLSRLNIAHLKVRDLQCFLHHQNVSTRGCVEKEELVNLCVLHVNSPAYRRRSSRDENSPFNSLKGLTNNINEFITTTFNLRTPASQPYPAPPPPTRSCHNSNHTHDPTTPTERITTAPGSYHNSSYSQRTDLPPPTERFTRPPGDPDIVVPTPEPAVSRSASEESARVDTADCFEIEDIDDQDWELVTRPADPLPNDSDVLLSSTVNSPREDNSNSVPDPPRVNTTREQETVARGRGLTPPASHNPAPPPAHPSPHLAPPRTPQRAASELELREGNTPDADSISLQDEPLPPSNRESTLDVSLENLQDEAALEELTIRQLKILLLRHKVDYRGAIERDDLLERARVLWRDTRNNQVDPDALPIEDACKICMSARLECVLLECGHMATCTRCAARLAECPICRRFVVRAVRFFRS